MRKLSLFLSIVLLASCGSYNKLARDEHIYWVNSLRVSCTGVAPMTCLQVQKGEVADPGAWQNFYDEIGGFDFQEGYVYKLVVREEELDQATMPADASSIRYSLVKVLEKNADPRFRLHDIWVLESISGESPETDAERPVLEIHLDEMRYWGTDGCNRYTGGLAEVGEEKIRFGMAAGTRMACPDMKVADQFNSLIPMVRRYEISDHQLYLFDGSGQEILVFRKTE